MIIACYQQEVPISKLSPGGDSSSSSGGGSNSSESGSAGSAASDVKARMRVAAFLQPQDPQFFDAGSKAVAVYDYDLRLQRV
jgi:hypothetical protein